MSYQPPGENDVPPATWVDRPYRRKRRRPRPWPIGRSHRRPSILHRQLITAVQVARVKRRFARMEYDQAIVAAIDQGVPRLMLAREMSIQRAGLYRLEERARERLEGKVRVGDEKIWGRLEAGLPGDDDERGNGHE